MKKTTSISQTLRVLQLVSCGAIVGLYAVKAAGFAGLDLPLQVETFGAGVGAAAVVVLKVLHLL